MTRLPSTLRRAAAGLVLVTLTATMLAGCNEMTHPPLATVAHIELQRFMGPWYVIANIPTFIEKGAHNAIESYELSPDGTIATTFTFNAGGFDGPKKTHRPRGFVLDSSNAVWGMRFIWPIKADYRITYVDPGYTQTIVSREARDYVWIMARTPQISEDDYQRLLKLVAEQGYDPAQVQRVPQRPAGAPGSQP
jgi:apolipoprotein D and lipocalin family protein